MVAVPVKPYWIVHLDCYNFKLVLHTFTVTDYFLKEGFNTVKVVQIRPTHHIAFLNK